MTKHVQIVFYSSFAILFLGILSPLLVEHFKPVPDLPTLSAAPEFKLTDSAGEEFSSSKLRGDFWLVNFFFTRCTGPCPIQAAKFKELAFYFSDHSNLKFLSITADPDNDTVEDLAAYAEKMNADTNRWHFLTGPKSQIIELLNNGFRLGAPDKPIYHSTRFVLVDQRGTIRGYYGGTDQKTVARLKRDIKNLLSKAS